MSKQNFICLARMVFIFGVQLFPVLTIVAKVDCENTRIFQGDLGPIEFCWSAQAQGWISPACLVRNAKKCDALIFSAGAHAALAALESSQFSGGRNPGGLVCNRLGGQVEIFMTERKSQVSFCFGADRSMIDCAALIR